jgi:hypothetical protein
MAPRVCADCGAGVPASHDRPRCKQHRGKRLCQAGRPTVPVGPKQTRWRRRRRCRALPVPDRSSDLLEREAHTSSHDRFSSPSVRRAAIALATIGWPHRPARRRSDGTVSLEIGARSGFRASSVRHPLCQFGATLDPRRRSSSVRSPATVNAASSAVLLPDTFAEVAGAGAGSATAGEQLRRRRGRVLGRCSRGPAALGGVAFAGAAGADRVARLLER